jgi:hypothetical protein
VAFIGLLRFSEITGNEQWGTLGCHVVNSLRGVECGLGGGATGGQSCGCEARHGKGRILISTVSRSSLMFQLILLGRLVGFLGLLQLYKITGELAAGSCF